MTFNVKDYVKDLIPNSAAIQVINDDFRHVFQDLRLWSFYETVKTNMGISQTLIVEKDSAVIGREWFGGPTFRLLVTRQAINSR